MRPVLGNAIDPAIAASAARGLMEPAMNGIGGDLFAIVYEAVPPGAPLTSPRRPEP